MERLEPARLRDLPALALVNGLAMAEAPVMAKIQSPALRSVLVWALAITGWWFWLVLIALKRRHTWRLGHRALVQIVPPGQTSRIVPRDAGAALLASILSEIVLTPLALLTWAAPSLVLLVSVASGLAVLLIPYPDRYAARWGLDELDAVVVVGAASASALKHRHARLLPEIDEHLRRRYPGALLLAHARDKRLMRAYSGRYHLEAAGDGIMRGRIPIRGEPTASEPGNEAD